jgi:hypothetical protein
MLAIALRMAPTMRPTAQSQAVNAAVVFTGCYLRFSQRIAGGRILRLGIQHFNSAIRIPRLEVEVGAGGLERRVDGREAVRPATSGDGVCGEGE